MAAADARPLLVELFVEELPPKALKSLGTAFAEALVGALRERGLVGDGATFTPFATPRRLAVHVESVAPQAPDRALSVKLMPAAVGLDADGRPTPALLKKLAALGADASAVPALQRRSDGKAESLYLERAESGVGIEAGLQAALDAAIAALPIPKVMQYQLADGWTSVSFVRPAHGLVALHGDSALDVHALGLRAGRTTFGHRFEASRAPIVLRTASSYEAQLRDEGAVIAGFETRRAEIARQLAAAAASAGLQAARDEALLDEVCGLVERPNVLVCAFDREFLEVPPECLVLTMKANQKYFPLLDGDGRLTHRFLVVSNITPADPGRVIEGNERVVRPRLADAKFFYDQDRRRTLAARVPALDAVVYHGRLGSQGDRVRRLRRIARWVAPRIGADAGLAERAAELAKADLLTDMVGEFPELQGVMGGYYAAHDGEAAAVAEAIGGQYVNRRGRGGDEPVRPVAEALLLADRAEALVGIWSIGGKPTGEKDPYALRRHALTVIRSLQLVAGSAPGAALHLRTLLEEAAASFDPPLAATVVPEVEAFVYERCFQQLAAEFEHRVVDAVLAPRPALHEAYPRLDAVRAFLDLPEAAALAAANKRVGNILKKSTEAFAPAVEPALLVEPAEQALAESLAAAGSRADAAYADGRYAESLQMLAALKTPVDAFFDTVMVNADDARLRTNRLALLAALRTTMNRVADLSRLAS